VILVINIETGAIAKIPTPIGKRTNPGTAISEIIIITAITVYICHISTCKPKKFI
jgi:hypothetical protein